LKKRRIWKEESGFGKKGRDRESTVGIVKEGKAKEGGIEKEERW
jgi:hypothetical protein